METIADMIIKFLGTAIGAGIICLISEALKYLRASMDEKERVKLDAFVSSLVAAADQMYKASDEDGSARLSYVQGMLIEAGYDLTDALRALIESKVHSLNVETKKSMTNTTEAIVNE